MRHSPRRPLILKRRKLPFPESEPTPARDVPDGAWREATPPTPRERGLPHALCIVDHTSMPDTQVVVVPKTVDLQSVIDSLSARGKECGPQGPSNFILLSGGSASSENWPGSRCPSSSGEGTAFGNPLTLDSKPESGRRSDRPVDAKPFTSATFSSKEQGSSPLNDSLTNIQWLGGMCSDGLGSDAGGRVSEKENQAPCAQRVQLSQHLDAAQRPPYSYMAMIQFAINSKPDRRMTLKEIYTWIEDHFPFFRNVAKPGWKNSIRHNLSLHDMFTRETSPDGKISFWTIRPEANRCLTLDQVSKQVLDPSTPYSTQVCEQQHLKPAALQIKKVAIPVISERKMKPLLSRADSYLVPIQLSLSPSLFLPSGQLPLAAIPQNCSSLAPELQGGGKRVRIAPKQCAPPPVEFKKDPLCVSLTFGAQKHPTQRVSRGSRRKQYLAPPPREEPMLLFPDSTFFDSGLTSELSASQDMGLESLGRACTFKTPIKAGRPTSSTPSKPIEGESAGASSSSSYLLLPWRTSPRVTDAGDALNFSPIRSPLGPSLTPQSQNRTPPFGFNSAPFQEPPLFSSPRELLTSSGARRSPLSPGGAVPANCSLTEGLVLDTMNNSLSKILVDISFSGLEDEELDVCNLSWSHLIPELK